MVFVNFVDLKPLTFNQTPFMLNEFGRYIRNAKLPAQGRCFSEMKYYFILCPFLPTAGRDSAHREGLTGHLPVKLDNKNSWI
jgi:hypothetical protein